MKGRFLIPVWLFVMAALFFSLPDNALAQAKKCQLSVYSKDSGNSKKGRARYRRCLQLKVQESHFGRFIVTVPDCSSQKQHEQDNAEDP